MVFTPNDVEINIKQLIMCVCFTDFTIRVNIRDCMSSVLIMGEMTRVTNNSDLITLVFLYNSSLAINKVED